MSKYYPIGTMVKLTIDEDMLFMIAGYLPTQDGGKAYDYFAVPYPMGLMKENRYISFNSDRITEVVHVGYCNDECQKILNGFDESFENIKKLINDGQEKK